MEELKGWIRRTILKRFTGLVWNGDNNTAAEAGSKIQEQLDKNIGICYNMPMKISMEI